MEVLTDLLLEKWKNFPEARQLGDESACFIRGELEATWGQSHLAILSEEEAQKWLLGVSIISFMGPKIALIRAKTVTIYFKVPSDVLTLRTNRTRLFLILFNNYIILFGTTSGVLSFLSKGHRKLSFPNRAY